MGKKQININNSKLKTTNKIKIIKKSPHNGSTKKKNNKKINKINFKKLKRRTKKKQNN